jgi:site-specific DNA-methyltransferase (adenine-specific)
VDEPLLEREMMRSQFDSQYVPELERKGGDSRMRKPDWKRKGALLYCGDCLEILPGLPTGAVDAVITDPPYGINYRSSAVKSTARRRRKVRNDERPFIWWLREAFRVTKDPGCLVCFTRWDVEEVFRIAIGAAGYVLKSQVIWDRVVHGMGDTKASFAPQHDTILFAVKGRFTFHGSRPKSVIRVPRVPASRLNHPTEKPLELMSSIVRAVAAAGSTVLDNHCGCGATGVACVQSGRNFIGIEIERLYFDVAVQRIEEAIEHTGR